MIPVDGGRCGICGRILTEEELDKYQPSPNMEDHSDKPFCPVCGRRCTTIYRRERYADIIGCNRCVYAVDAVEDADAVPEDYGADKDDEENVPPQEPETDGWGSPIVNGVPAPWLKGRYADIIE